MSGVVFHKGTTPGAHGGTGFASTIQGLRVRSNRPRGPPAVRTRTDVHGTPQRASWLQVRAGAWHIQMVRCVGWRWRRTENERSDWREVFSRVSTWVRPPAVAPRLLEQPRYGAGDPADAVGRQCGFGLRLGVLGVERNERAERFLGAAEILDFTEGISALTREPHLEFAGR